MTRKRLHDFSSAPRSKLFIFNSLPCFALCLFAYQVDATIVTLLFVSSSSASSFELSGQGQKYEKNSSLRVKYSFYVVFVFRGFVVYVYSTVLDFVFTHINIHIWRRRLFFQNIIAKFSQSWLFIYFFLFGRISVPWGQILYTCRATGDLEINCKI